MEIYNLIINNNLDFSTRLANHGIFIIDLALTSTDLGLLQIWEICEKYPSLSDYEVILLE